MTRGTRRVPRGTMHSILRSAVETCVTISFIAWAVPMGVLYLWRSVRLKRTQVQRLVTPSERLLTSTFLICLTLVDPLSVHLHHFVPDGIANPLPTAALLAWVTANVFCIWLVAVAAFSRSYCRGLIYLPLPVQTTTLLFVAIDTISDREANLVTIPVVVTALVGIWTCLFLPKMFQTTEEMLCAIDPTKASYAMSRVLSQSPLETGPPLDS